MVGDIPFVISCSIRVAAATESLWFTSLSANGCPIYFWNYCITYGLFSNALLYKADKEMAV